MVIFGMVGYLMKKYKYDAPPLVLAFVLGTRVEESLRRSLLMSGGSPFIFLQRPISAVLFLFAILLLLSPFLPALHKKKADVFSKIGD